MRRWPWVGGFIVMAAGCGSSSTEPAVDAAVDPGVRCDVEAPATVEVTGLRWGVPTAGIAVRSFTTSGEVVDLAMTDTQGIARVEGCHYVGIMDGDGAWTEPLAGRSAVTFRSRRIGEPAPTTSVSVATENHPLGALRQVTVATGCGEYFTHVPGSITTRVCAADQTTPFVAAVVNDAQQSPSPTLAVAVTADGPSLTFDTWSPVVEVPVTITGIPAGAWGSRADFWALVGPNVWLELRRLPTSLPAVIEASVNVDGFRTRHIRRRYQIPPASVELRFDEFPDDLAEYDTLRDNGVPIAVTARLPEAMDDCGLTILLRGGDRRVTYTGPQAAGLVHLRLPRLPADAEGTVNGAWVHVTCWNGGGRPRWPGERIEPAPGIDLRLISGPAGPR